MLRNEARKKKRAWKSWLSILSVTFVFLFVAGYLTLHQAAASRKISDQASSTPIIDILNLAVNTKWGRLEDQDHIFSVQYPKGILKAATDQGTFPPHYNDKERTYYLNHNLAVPQCDETGENCTAAAKDFSISFAAVQKPFNDVWQELHTAYGKNLKVVTIDGHQGIGFNDYTLGVSYSIVPIDDAKTLFIAKKSSSDFKKNPNSIKPADQDLLYDKVMATFQFK